MVVCAYLLQVELRVPRVAALVVTLVVVVASPAYLLYENWLNYAYPTAAFGTVGAWCLVRFLRTGRARFGLGFFGAYAADGPAQQHLPGRMAAGGGGAGRGRAAAPVAHRPGRGRRAGRGRGRLVREGLRAGRDHHDQQLAGDEPGPFGPLSGARRTDRRAAAPGAHERRRLHSALRRPRGLCAPLRPGRARSRPAGGGAPQVRRGHQLQQPAVRPHLVAVPARRPRLDRGPSPRVRRRRPQLARGVVRRHRPELHRLGQLAGHPPYARSTTGTWSGSRPRTRPPASWSSPAGGIGRAGCRARPWPSTRCALVGAPVLVWRRRKSDPALAGTLAVLWWTTAYAFTTSSLVEIGENERFRSELGPVPTILAVVVVTAVVRVAWSVSRRTPERCPGRAGGHVEVKEYVTPSAVDSQ